MIYCVLGLIVSVQKKTKEHLSFFIKSCIINNEDFISLQGVFWRSQLYIDQPLFLKFNISLEKDALVGVYGRKGLAPSHTQVGSKKVIVWIYSCRQYQNPRQSPVIFNYSQTRQPRIERK